MKWSDLPSKQRNHIKNLLAVRDGLICCICKRPIKTLRQATVEHKIKQRHGGSHNLSNLGLAHARCNYSDQHEDLKNDEVIDNSSFF